jgi:hypothetical protein
MKTLKTGTVSTPIDHLPTFDLTLVFQWMAGCVSAVYTICKVADGYFKNKQAEKQEFIKNVAVAAVNAVLDGVLKDVNNKIDALFDYREKDRTHSDQKFSELMKEIKRG